MGGFASPGRDEAELGERLTFGVEEIEGSVPERFRNVVSQVPPDHTAWVDAGVSHTYAGLDRASDSVAARIAELVPWDAQALEQQAIALWLPHAVFSFVGILGVLKAGHFYVPLDPVLGAATIAFILRDCPPRALVTVRALYDSARALTEADSALPFVCIDELPAASAPALSKAARPSGSSLLSVQYTSGSTGRPRGVPRAHNRVLHSARSAHQLLRYGPGDRVAHTVSYAYAMSSTSMFGSLMCGATIHALAVRDVPPTALYDWLAQERITKLDVSVGMLRSLAGLADSRPELPALRGINAGGEAVARLDAERILRLMPAGGRLITRLASTEAGTMAALVSERGKIPGTGERLPAGYVPEDIEVLILDEQGQPLPMGEVGQIAVHSRWLIPGYWNQPELTDQRLIPDPTGGDCHTFLTGDLGRYTEDGMLEHLGRMDHMVKVRGYRVELGVIEQTLAEHPNVAECAVVARAGRDGNNRLFAYYVPRQAPAPTLSELRAWLLNTLPEYMVPARYITMGALPRTGTQKIDRKALPAPGRERPAVVTPYVAPRTEAEARLAAIWADVLDLDEVGAEDDFTELGGDSLSALHMAVHIEEQLGRKVPSEWFRHTTLSDLAALLEDASVGIEADTSAPAAEEPRVTARAARAGDAQDGLGRGLVIHGGPVVGRLALPYPLGARLQRALYGVAFARRRLLRNHLGAFQACLAEAGLRDTDGERLTQLLIANTWRRWRLAALQAPGVFERYVTVDGKEELQRAVAGGKGLIVVFVHQACSIQLAQKVLRDLGRERFFVLGNTPGAGEQSELERVMERTTRAYDELAAGGVAFVAADGRLGSAVVPFPFYGHTMPLRRGFAELAWHSGAAVVALFGYTATDGHATVEFRALPTPDSAEAATALVLRYGQMLAERWPRLLANMPWARLAWLQNLPRSA